jgi:hypothetical protein
MEKQQNPDCQQSGPAQHQRSGHQHGGGQRLAGISPEQGVGGGVGSQVDPDRLGQLGQVQAHCGCQHADEGVVVAPADAVADPFAVVVELARAAVALHAVLGVWLRADLADGAEQALALLVWLVDAGVHGVD